ncbi:hypothetical protein CC2G_011137 [Coprinopsis cinerea AmutBmut pab1-1]|nr:hypothetical protein CC2G_011137 [Coprinopsis cinerea AmutBmut pab1-1]
MHETLFSTVDGDAFYQYFWDWEPSQSDRVATRAVDAITIPSLQPSASLHSAEGEGKWEFSTRTLQTWARLLCQLIGELDEALDEVESSEESPGTSTGWEDSTIKVNEHCMALHTLLREGVLETLLLRTSLGSFLEEKLRNCCSAVSLPQHFIEDVTIDVQWQGNEARANQVLRFLEGLLSWHDAVHNLQKNVGEIMSLPADKVNVAIVKQSAVAHDLLPLSQICDFITGRRSDAQDSELFPSSEDAQGLLRSLCDYDEGKKFAGSVHPEATLLGLVTHWNTPHPVNYDAEINDVEELAMMLQKRDRFIAVGSSNQCCFCCHIVGRHKEEDVIDAYPGTNGVIHPWTPPRVGVKLSILKDVEAFLWDQLESIIKAHWDPPLSSIMRYRCESHSPTSQRDPTASLLLGFHDLPPSPPSSTYYRSTISPDVARRLQENRSQDRIIREMFHSPTSPSLRDLDYISECDSSPSTNESELIPDMEWRSLLRRGSRSSGKRVVRLPSLPSPRQRPHKALEPDDSDAGSDGGCPCSHPFSSDFLQPSLSRRSSAGSFHSNHDARRSHRRLSQSSAAGRQHPYR